MDEYDRWALNSELLWTRRDLDFAREELKDAQEETDRVWCLYENLRLRHEELEQAYDELAQELGAADDAAYKLECELEDLRGGKPRGRDGLPYLEDSPLWNMTIDDLVEQRDEARGIAGELFAWIRSVGRVDTTYMSQRELADWRRVRPGVRKALER